MDIQIKRLLNLNQRKRKNEHTNAKETTKIKIYTTKKTGAGLKVIEQAKDKLNVRYKGVQRTIDALTKKRIEQVARKTIRIAKKVKNPKTFERSFKKIHGKNF